MNEAQIDWLLGTLAFLLMWIMGYWGQRGHSSSRERIRVSMLTAFLVGYPSASTASISNTGWQMLALAMFLANSGLTLLVPNHQDRVALLTATLGVFGLVDAVIVTVLRNRISR